MQVRFCFVQRTQRRTTQGHTCREAAITHRISFLAHTRKHTQIRTHAHTRSTATHTRRTPPRQVACDLSNDPVAMYADSVPGKPTRKMARELASKGARAGGAGGERTKAPHGESFRYAGVPCLGGSSARYLFNKQNTKRDFPNNGITIGTGFGDCCSPHNI